MGMISPSLQSGEEAIKQPHEHGFLIFYPFLRRHYQHPHGDDRKQKRTTSGAIHNTTRPSNAPHAPPDIRPPPCKQTLLQSLLCPACCGNHNVINSFHLSVIHPSRSIVIPFDSSCPRSFLHAPDIVLIFLDLISAAPISVPAL